VKVQDGGESRARKTQVVAFIGARAREARVLTPQAAAAPAPDMADSASGRRLDGPRRARRLGRSGLGRAHGLGPIW
jgi:hypothetical protein